MIRNIARRCITQYTKIWPDYSSLFLISDMPVWSIARDMLELSKMCKLSNVRVKSSVFANFCENQCVFLGSHFDLLLTEKWLSRKNRLATAYFHGKPGTGIDEFDVSYERLCVNHNKIQRIQVSYSEMRDVILESGIAPKKVFLIPIAINLDYFQMQSSQSRKKMRAELGIPESAQVIGSFQKDGVGWGDGRDPKLIKGPDVFLKTVEILKSKVPELFVLLSGPARGYMKTGLERLGIPYVHKYQKSYSDIGKMFQALDLYIIPSREEGGPKAVLESMASGVPLVSTRVGQAMDLIRHGENGWLTQPEEHEGLAHWAEYAIHNRQSISNILKRGRVTAEENTYTAQLPLWREFMRGFVESHL